MAEIPIRFSMIDTKTTMVKKRNQSLSNNLFHNHQRSHLRRGNATLPIISLSSFSNLDEKFIHMATNNKSVIASNISSEFRTAQIKLRRANPNRLIVSNMPKSSLSYPTTITRPATSHRSINQNTRFLYVVNTPSSTHRTVSARIPNKNVNHQQQSSPSILSRPISQYGHFLSYLRRQSLARMRRKQEEEEGNTDNIETTITFNLNKQTPKLFQSISHFSLGSSTTDTLSMPTISMTAKRAGRPLSSYQQFQRSSLNLTTNYRLNSIKPPPLTPSKNSANDRSLLITPRNSVVDDTDISPIIKAPYELQLNDDMLKYCYVSDSGVTYQGQMLSTAV